MSTPELIGKSRLEYYYDRDDALAVIERDREIMDSGKAVVIEEVLTFPSGAKTYFTSKTPWKDREGNIIGIIVVARDITDRIAMECDLKRIARELEQKNSLVTDFFINLSHEFKTPISIMLIAIELIEQHINNNGADMDLKDNISAIKQNAMRLSRLVHNLLDITKIDAGFMQANFTNEDLTQLLQHLVKSLEVFTLKKSIGISFYCSKKSIMMPVDKVWIDRIMLNLISNALKHTPAGGSIWVTCNTKNNKVVISVKDNGEGIPEDKKEIIFDRFRQVNSSLARSSEGCGLGLALTRSLVEMLGGRIWFESRIGEGSEFFIELPVLAAGKQKSIVVDGLVLEQRIRMELSDIVFG
jgi:signal transduction histidine kinase